MKKSAYDQGKLYGMVNAAGNPTPETVIFESMRNNPFKSTKSQEDFVKGVSYAVNELSCIRTHREVYGNA